MSLIATLGPCLTEIQAHGPRGPADLACQGIFFFDRKVLADIVNTHRERKSLLIDGKVLGRLSRHGQFASPVPCSLSPVSCFLSPVSCPPSPVRCSSANVTGG